MHKFGKYVLCSIISIIFSFYLFTQINILNYLSLPNKLSIEINPFDIVSTLVTIGLAFYVTRNLSKLTNKENKEKSLLIHRIQDLNKAINQKIENIIYKDDCSISLRASTFKILRRTFNSIRSLTVEFSSIEKNDKNLANLEDCLTDIWELLTDTPKRDSDATTSTNKEDFNKLTPSQVRSANEIILKMDELFFKLIIEINSK